VGRRTCRTRYSRLCRPTVVLRERLLRVVHGLLADCRLRCNRSHMAFMHGSHFLRARLNRYAAVSAVIADAVGGLHAVMNIIDDDIVLVDVVDDIDIHIVYVAVVIEVISLPVAAEVAEADVAEAVIDAAVEADVRSPVTTVEHVVAAVVSPVGWGPKSAVVRRG